MRFKLLAGVVLAILPARFGAGQDSVTAFVNVNVVPMDAERVLADHVVIVRDTRIESIVPRADAIVPDGATVIDGRGGYLAPGLADMHVHVFDPQEQVLFIANGVTTLRNMWGMPLHLAWRKTVAEDPSELICNLHTAAALADGEPPIWPTSTVLTTAKAARDYVREAKEQGYDFLKVYNRLKPEVYVALVDEAGKQGIPFAGHVPDAVGLSNVLDARQRTIEHLSGYFAALQREDSPFRQGVNAFGRPAMVRFIDEARIEEIASQTRDAGTWNCVTLVVMDKFRARFDLQAELQRPEMRFVSPVWRSQWMGRIDPDQPPNDDQRLTLEAGSAMRRTIVAALHEAGARILLGSDTPNPFVVPGFSIHEELVNLTQSGLSPYEAIRAGTHDAAEFLGALDTFGTVRAGCRADLVLTESNPLDDVANLAQPRGVMLRGRWLDREELDQRLEELAKSHID